jgi:hypothetical protein
MKKVLFALLVLGVLAGLAGIILNNVGQSQQKDATSAFAGHLPAYMAIWRGRAADDGYKVEPFLMGKAVIVETKGRRIDPLTFQLPDSIRAEIPEEVYSLIFLDCQTPEVGSYTNGAKARDHVCEIVIYDMGTAQVVYANSVVRYAPGSISLEQSGTGERPDEEVLEAIASISNAE